MEILTNIHPSTRTRTRKLVMSALSPGEEEVAIGQVLQVEVCSSPKVTTSSMD